MHNNTLPVNTVLSHFVQGRNCTFCEISRNPDPEDETPYHLFYDCQTTERLRNNFYIWLLDDNNFTVRRHEFFCCGFGDRDWEIWMAVNNLFKLYIWECRARYCLPEIQNLKKFILFELYVMGKVSKKFELKYSKYARLFDRDRIQ
jgi:hypothetical protein